MLARGCANGNEQTASHDRAYQCPPCESQKCSACGNTVKKSLSTRTHVCKCGCRLDRDENVARNILAIALKIEPSRRRPCRGTPVFQAQQVGWGTPELLDVEDHAPAGARVWNIQSDTSENASGDIDLWKPFSLRPQQGRGFEGPRACCDKSDR